ncbi:MAG: SDR family oxidoreductase [Planctomycetota bacterium]|nr:MAG: SDR family oxidoreductase [Planctomycetota bacterium]
MADTATVVITGVSRGLGRALAERFIERGWRVAGCGRTTERVDALRRRFPHHAFSVVDVSDDAQVKAWATELLAHLGPPDLLLNNAAVINRNAPLWKVPAAEFERVLHVNVCGIANVIRHFVPAMIDRGRGVIVNFSSGWGRSTAPEVAPYCASKWAVEGLTRALAQELPPTMAAVPLNPGIIDTDMLRSCFGRAAAHYPSADEWSRTAVEYILALGPDDNGMPRTVGDR